MKCDSTILNRMKRLQGQFNGVIKMMEEERSCADIITQLSSSNSNVGKTMSLITTRNLINTIEQEHHITIDNIDEALELVVKSK